MSSIDAYDYELPRELIAQHPLPQRGDARLLVVRRDRGELEHWHIRDLPELLAPDDLLVLNNTRVIPARLAGYRKRTQGRWSGLFLQEEDGVWRVLSKARGKLQAGESIVLQSRDLQDVCELTMLTPLEQGQWAAQPNSETPTWELLEQVGRVPLPPYIRDGQMADSDEVSYQTVFASQPGAVAAPTAGLHFTDSLLETLKAKGLETCQITLHVGLGTFRPIAVEQLDQHVMHSERGELSPQTAERIRQKKQAGGRVVSVGTTVTRVLETAAAEGELQSWRGQTELFIRPPYQFRAVDALLTNFHLPKSTLLVLVRCFGGDQLIQRAYQEAVQEGYRFYSYGDAMLIL